MFTCRSHTSIFHPELSDSKSSSCLTLYVKPASGKMVSAKVLHTWSQANFGMLIYWYILVNSICPIQCNKNTCVFHCNSNFAQHWLLCSVDIRLYQMLDGLWNISVHACIPSMGDFTGRTASAQAPRKERSPAFRRRSAWKDIHLGLAPSCCRSWFSDGNGERKRHEKWWWLLVW